MSDMVIPSYVHAWGGGGRPKEGPVPGERALNYTQMRLYQHVCGHVEEWRAEHLVGDGEGCDACESAAFPGAWQPLYRQADSYGQPAVVSATAVVSAHGAPNPQADLVMADTPAPGRRATCPQCGLEPIADGYSVCEVCAFAPGRGGGA